QSSLCIRGGNCVLAAQGKHREGPAAGAVNRQPHEEKDCAERRVCSVVSPEGGEDGHNRWCEKGGSNNIQETEVAERQKAVVLKESEPIDYGHRPLRQSSHARKETDGHLGKRKHHHNQGSDSADSVKTFPAGVCRFGIKNPPWFRLRHFVLLRNLLFGFTALSQRPASPSKRIDGFPLAVCRDRKDAAPGAAGTP